MRYAIYIEVWTDRHGNATFLRDMASMPDFQIQPQLHCERDTYVSAVNPSLVRIVLSRIKTWLKRLTTHRISLPD